MGRFYFHVWESGSLLDDEDGSELPDGNAAILIAKTVIGELLCEDIASGRDLAGRCIVIADEDGNTIAEISSPRIEIEEHRPEVGTPRAIAGGGRA